MSLRALLVAGTLCALLRGQSGPVQPAQPQPVPTPAAQKALPPGMPPTQLGVETLAESPVVVVARVVHVRQAGVGGELIRLRVLERMRGDAALRDAEVSMLAPAGSLPFGSEQLLFLRPFRGGERMEMVQCLSASEPHYDERLVVVRRTIWLLEVRETERRVDATLDLLIELLGSEKEWTRGYALGELRWMAQQARALFTPERIARLRAAGRVSPRADVRTGVDSVASLLTSAPSRVPSAPDAEHSRP